MTKTAPSKLGLAFAASLLIAACAPIINTRGHIFDDSKLANIEKGVTTYDALVRDFGSPTTTSAVGKDAVVYYIYSRIATESYRAPLEEERKVLAVYFDDGGKVRDHAVYGLEDGIVIPIVRRTTETQGKELSAILQLLGNVGRFEGSAAP